MRKLSRLSLVFALAIPLLTAAGCVPHRQWGPGEETYYVQWEQSNHYQHVPYGQRSRDQQRAYRKWRKHHHDQ
jgi:hypothetical protein